MHKVKMSRRDLMTGAAGMALVAGLPLRGLTAAWAQGQNPMAAAQQPNTGAGRAAWMQSPRYAWGVMTHYLADWQAARTSSK